jgi:D-glycero-alpha-D-manno-heptose-7-phosphate kinase
MANGALGGKLLGAGGGGFLLFYCEKKNQERLRNALNIKEMKFKFDYDGTSVLYIGAKYWD